MAPYSTHRQNGERPSWAVVLPVGPGAETALDTLDSIEHFCGEPSDTVIVVDNTADGTYEALLAARKPHWSLLRNARSHGRLRLVQTLCTAYRHVLAGSSADLVLRIDQDALVIAPGLIAAAGNFAASNPECGIFGVHDHDYNRPRSFSYHQSLITREVGWWRNLFNLRPSWTALLRKAEEAGYRRGDNVFGGAYFITRECLQKMHGLGALEVPFNWHSILMEDVYFSMACAAAGMKLGHFAAPDGPLCLEWEGLPMPAGELLNTRYKLVHSVDKGKNTSAAENGGLTAREVFRKSRSAAKGLLGAREGRHGPAADAR